MDFTVGKSWYNERKSSLSTETSHAKRRVKGKEVAGAQSNTILLTNVEPPTATNNPTPSRLRPTHVPLLESIASQAEQSRDEENDIIKQASLRSTKMIQQPDNEDQKLHQKFPMEMTFEQAMKNYSPPTKRSRWADMFESRRFDRIATPPSFFSLSSRKTSPPSLLSSFSRRMSPKQF
ncbi:hypothetical protein EYC84_003780 [Monilinia fructicola]|uniref:Uncharacterized protein n=1 Tax=Monilinia fructicola TaxID=38448 RepID=A0A5M9K010_MONFR|nr:hypothetical protein EYC84_003780 [Monilinia fructicola]